MSINNKIKSVVDEGVVCLYDEQGSLVGILHKGQDRKNIFYSCTQMDFDELKALIKQDNA